MNGRSAAPTVAVIGVGNEWRRDDGVGWVVARAVDGRVHGAVDIVLTDGEPTRLLAAWDGVDLAVVIDAVRTGSTPGTVCMLGLGDVLDGTPRAGSPHASHALGLGAAARLGEALGNLPGHLVVVGVEGADFSDGLGLSAAVATAVERAVDVVCHQVRLAPLDGRAGVMTGPAPASGRS